MDTPSNLSFIKLCERISVYVDVYKFLPTFHIFFGNPHAYDLLSIQFLWGSVLENFQRIYYSLGENMMMSCNVFSIVPHSRQSPWICR